MSRMNVVGLLIIGITVAAFFAWQLLAYKTPEPSYTVIEASGPIEIRDYPQMVVAEVAVQGERYQAIKQGFKILADYIFGNNQGEQKIAMTAPVMQQGAKINMTAPVMQQQDGDGWLVQFVMPQKYTKATLPKPNNKEVVLTTVPSSRYVVIRFSGSNSDANLQSHLKILQDYVLEKQLKVNPTPLMAFYNPPWILPFFRRNEIMLQIRK